MRPSHAGALGVQTTHLPLEHTGVAPPQSAVAEQPQTPPDKQTGVTPPQGGSLTQPVRASLQCWGTLGVPPEHSV